MKFISVSLVVLTLQCVSASADCCRSSLKNCSAEKNDSLEDFKKLLVKYQQGCEEKEHFRIQFVQRTSGIYQLEIGVNASFEHLLLLMCGTDEAYFGSSSDMHAVSTCSYKNDTYVVAKHKQVQQILPVYVHNWSTETALKYIVLDHKLCSHQGVLKVAQRQVVHQHAERDQLHMILRNRRQISTAPPYLLVTSYYNIHQVSLDGIRSHAVVSNLKGTLALDYNYRRRKMYWTDSLGDAIIQSNLDGSGKKTLLSQGLSQPDGLAVDWITNKLYFTDSSLDIVGVFDPVHFYYRVLFQTGMNTQPKDIVLDPNTRMMYWADWGEVARIERASMDGSNRQVLHNTSLTWPYGLTIDYQSQTLYWADGNLEKIESSRVDGTNRILLTSNGFSRPYGIAYYQNVLFVAESTNKTIRTLSSTGGEVNILTKINTCSYIYGIQVIDIDNQPMTMNPCGTGNGGCSHLCLLSTSSGGYSCACPDGLNLEGDICLGIQNGSIAIIPEVQLPATCTSAGYSSCCTDSSCLGSPPSCYCDANCHLYGDCCSDVSPDCINQGYNPYMVVSERKYMRHFDLKTPTRSRTFLSNLNNSISIDYHYRMNAIFWSDNINPGIQRSSLNGSGILPVLLNTSDIGSIAIDWISDKLYWSDYSENTINVIDLHTGYRRTLFTLSAYRPIDILVDPNTRYLYWTETDGSLTSGRVVQASMDGLNGFTILVNTSGITVITIDYSEQTLYWYSGNQLGSIKTNGSNSQIINGAMPEDSTIAFFLSYLENGVLHFTVYGRYNVYLVYVNGTLGEMPQLSTGCYGFTESKVISKDRQPIQGGNPCATNNGGCSDLCLLSAFNSDEYSCACHNDVSLLADGMSCPDTVNTQPLPQQGSCQAAGNNGCCSSGDCRGSPQTCGCDISCVSYSDCCSDFISLCTNFSTTDPQSDIPEFFMQPSNLTIIENMTGSLQCSLSSTFYATIEWTFAPTSGDQTLVIANQQGSFYSRYSVVPSTNGLSLIFNSANYSTDQGTYTCRGKANGNTISSSAHVNVLFPPSSISLSGSMVVNENDPFKLVCEVRANPAPVVVWWKRSEGKVTIIVDTSTRISISGIYNTKEAIYTNTLAVSRALPSDGGEYVCEAYNFVVLAQTIVASITLKITEVDECLLYGESPCLNGGICVDSVGAYSCKCTSGFMGTNCGNIDEPDPLNDAQPMILKPPVSTNADLIASINLTCMAEGFPLPNYQWFKDGVLLSGETQPVLYFLETSPEDRGNYTCTAINGKGTSQSVPARLDIPGIYQYSITMTSSEGGGIQEVLFVVASSSTADFPFSVYSVEHLPGTSNSSTIILLVTLYNKDATAAVIRDAFLSYLEALPSISLLSTIRFDGCEASEFDGFLWPETDVRDYASVECPCSEFVSTLAGKALHYCAGDYMNGACWENTVDTSLCVVYSSLITGKLCGAAAVVANFTTEVAMLVADVTANYQELTPADIAVASSLLDQLTSDAIENTEVTGNYLEIINNLQKADPEAVLMSNLVTKSSQRIIDNLATFSSSLVVKSFSNSSNEDKVVFSFDTYAIQLQDTKANSFQGQTFSVDLSSVEKIKTEENTIKKISIKTSAMIIDILDKSTAAVQLPQNFISNITECGRGQPGVTWRIIHYVFLTDILFQSQNQSASDLGSVILSTELTCIGNRTLTHPITINFRTNDEVRNNTTDDGSCVRWNPDLDEFGGWSTSGCRNVSKGGNRVECECRQLGHFGILFDLNPRPPPREVAILLNVITYIGAIISLICLFAMVLTYLCSKPLRSCTHALILMNMSLSLAGLYAFFLIGGYVTSISLLCGFSAAFLHYFMLVFFSWTAVEAVWLYYKLVKVFGSSSFEKQYIWKAGIPAWIIPLVVVIICAGSAHQYYISDYYCNVTRWPFWFGFLLPFLILYVFDWIVFVITFVSIFKHRKKIESQTKTTGGAFAATKETLIIASSLAILFGLGWGFGLLATSSPVKEITSALQILFSIFVGLQGILLFLLHGVRSKEARRVWKRWAITISCGKSFLVRSSRSTTKTSQATNKIRSTDRYTVPQKTDLTKDPKIVNAVNARIVNVNQTNRELGSETYQNVSNSSLFIGSESVPTFTTSAEATLSSNFEISEDVSGVYENIYDTIQENEHIYENSPYNFDKRN